MERLAGIKKRAIVAPRGRISLKNAPHKAVFPRQVTLAAVPVHAVLAEESAIVQLPPRGFVESGGLQCQPPTIAIISLTIRLTIETNYEPKRRASPCATL